MQFLFFSALPGSRTARTERRIKVNDGSKYVSREGSAFWGPVDDLSPEWSKPQKPPNFPPLENLHKENHA